MPTTPNIKMVTPSLDDIPDVPRDLQVIADHLDTKGVGIDADNLGGVTLPDTGAPLSLYGTGRPDTENITAPTGSTYTLAGDQTQLDAVFGARTWRKTPTDWVCVEGFIMIQCSNSNHATYVTRQAEAVFLSGATGTTISSSFEVLVPEGWRPAGGGSTSVNYNSSGESFGGRWGVVRYRSNNNYRLSFLPNTANAGAAAAAEWSMAKTTIMGADWPTAVPSPDADGNTWVVVPGGDTTAFIAARVAELKAEIEQAAKDNPELAEQLRQELEALQARE